MKSPNLLDFRFYIFFYDLLVLVNILKMSHKKRPLKRKIKVPIKFSDSIGNLGKNRECDESIDTIVQNGESMACLI